MATLRGTISLRDTLSGEVKTLDSSEKPELSIYVCGLTVYDAAHIGHAKTIVFFDVLRRVLEAKGFRVNYVQNFTDVDDKIIARAKKLGVKASALAESNIRDYFRDFGLLNVEGATAHPRATENIGEMQQFISGLMNRGLAYTTETGIYFDVSRFPSYGKLSKVKLQELKSGARVDPDPAKRNPADFALWKFADDEPSWESPWGRGRPGWHLECSAMVRKYLGETIDIHGGGEDLIFPHHENEIAQSESLTGAPLCRIWMHVGLLNLADEKMSKSLGNIITVQEAVKKWGANTLRYFLISNRYRNQVRFTEEGLKNSNLNWGVIESAAYELRYPSGKDGEFDDAELRASFDKFDFFLSDDVDTPGALAELVKVSRLILRLASQGRLGPRNAKAAMDVFGVMFRVLGFKLPEPTAEERVEVEALISRRASLRSEGKYREADEIRQRLASRGIRLVDRKDGTIWMKVESL
jgi:cysteinyl-tRNA synthetase